MPWSAQVSTLGQVKYIQHPTRKIIQAACEQKRKMHIKDKASTSQNKREPILPGTWHEMVTWILICVELPAVSAEGYLAGCRVHTVRLHKSNWGEE